MLDHPFPPFFDASSTILILGSFPSVRSREDGFFYGHPQNRFWRVLAAVFDEAEMPQTIEQKKQLLVRHHVALWDVAASCEIDGSADSSLRNVVGNDLSVILDHAPIKRIFLNGKAAERYYRLLIEPSIGRTATVLPSTSPANAAWSLERLTEAWRIIKE
ncbi:MAG: DNA-deoxyinosine glycosylase [Clostridia bacterium]|nr:DNA-deoxyinosine glycosylase [Clostridia bacterium]